MRPLDVNARDRRAWLTVAFIVPVMIVFAAYTLVTNIAPNEKYTAITMRSMEFREDDMFSAVSSDVDSIISIKAGISSDDLSVRTSAVRELLTEHMSIVFLLGILIGPAAAAELFRVLFFLKFGLAGSAFFYFLRKNIGLKNDPALLVSSVYSVSSVVMFYAALDSSLMNSVIFLPLLLSAVDTLNRKGGLKNIFAASLLFAVMAISGFGGFINCVPFCILFGIFMLLCDRKRTVGDILFGILRILLTAASGVLIAAVAVFPMIRSIKPVTDIAEMFKAGEVRFFMIDLLYRMLDGNITGQSIGDSAPVLGISVFAFILAMLFFANKEIPLRARLFGGFLMLIIYISVAYSALDELFCVSKGTGELTYSRIICLACLIVTVAAISLKNISCLSKNSIYLAAFIVIGLVAVESSSAADISPNTVSRLFSVLCAIFWCAVFVHVITVKKELPTTIITVALFGLFFNVLFCLGPARFAVDDLCLDRAGKNNTSSDFEMRLREGESIPIFADERESYIVLLSDVRGSLVEADAAQSINVIARAAQCNDLFTEVFSESYFLKDSYEAGGGRFGGEASTSRNEITIHAVLADAFSRYYIVSMFPYEQYVDENYADSDIHSTFNGAFMLQMTPSDQDAYIKLAFINEDSMVSSFRVYMLRDDAVFDFNSRTGLIENGTMDLSGDERATTPGLKTVITSIPYDDSYRVKYTKDGKTVDAETFEICGKLAFAFENSQGTDLTMRIDHSSSDVTAGIVVTLFMTACIIICALMYNKNTRVDKEKEELAEQKD